MIYIRVLNPPNTSLVALPCFLGIIDCAELQAEVRPADLLHILSPRLKPIALKFVRKACDDRT